MTTFEIVIWIAVILFGLYLLNQLYIMIIAFRWRSQDRVIARALEPRDD